MVYRMWAKDRIRRYRRSAEEVRETVERMWDGETWDVDKEVRLLRLLELYNKILRW